MGQRELLAIRVDFHLWIVLANLTRTLLQFSTLFFLDGKGGEFSLSEQNTWEEAKEHLWQSVLHGEEALPAADLNGFTS